MFSIKADLQFSNTRRKRPISGEPYRPILFFSEGLNRSGLIVLAPGEQLEMDQAYPDRLIKIYFYKDLDVTKEFYPGRPFVMGEGGAPIGRGVITEIIGETE